MNKFRLFYLIGLVVVCSTAYAASIDTEQMINQISKNLYYRDKSVGRDTQVNEIENIMNDLESAINKEPDNPAYRYIYGLANWSRLVILGSTLTTEEQQKLKQPAFESFRKALELDKSKDHKLTLDMLYGLKKFGSSDVHVEAAQRILSEDPNLEPRSELEIRGGMVTHLIRMGKYDEAINTLDEWAAKYPEQADRVTGYKKHAERLIDKAKQAEKNRAVAPEPSSAKEPEKPQPQNVAPEPTQTPQQPKQVAEPKPQPPDTTKSPTVSSRLIIVIAVLAVLIIAVFVIVRRKSK